MGHGLKLCASRQEQVVDTCKRGNEHSGTIKFRDFLE